MDIILREEFRIDPKILGAGTDQAISGLHRFAHHVPELTGRDQAAAAGHQAFADHWRLVSGTAARARRWCLRYRRDLITAAR